MTALNPNRGEIWSADFNPTTGHEQAGVRPALILSVDKFNHGPAELVIVVPMTSKNKHLPVQVAVLPPEGGLTKPSFIKCDDIRSISKKRLRQYYGRVSARTLREVEDGIKLLLSL